MSDYVLRYDKMVETALRNVVRETLTQVSKDGLPADHHFYITFDTGDDRVEIPEYLQKRYPSEMTIVLQHQFYGLKIDEEKFSVTLSFNNSPERLVVPFDAIRIFADPSVSFALQFETPFDDIEDDPSLNLALDSAIPKEPGRPSEKLQVRKPAKGAADNEDAEDEEKRGEVVSLAAFRKKQKDED